MRMPCGNWSAVLAEDMEGEHQLTDTVLKCTGCGALNAMAATVDH
jgi:hypothetical protein